MEFFLIEAVIAAFIIFVGVMLDRRMRLRVNEAVRSVSGSQALEFRARFLSTRVRSYWTGLFMYLALFAGFLLLAIIGFTAYTLFIEPKAELGIQVFLGVIMYGLVVIPLIITTGFLVARVIQGNYLNKVLKEQEPTEEIKQIRAVLAPRVGEIGVSAMAVIAVVISALSGAAILVFLFMASQSAIECARSSKCI